MNNVYIEGLGLVTVRYEFEDSYWHCEGIEYDFLSYGDTKEDALYNFKVTFEETIKLNIERFGKWNAERWKYPSFYYVKVPQDILDAVKDHIK